ncbi:hypothetical protein BGZ76_000617 [Entomortierella beljakovae]|nr:hypothetical protein BGZ76_000617 [Entomortierella beljakovae]
MTTKSVQVNTIRISTPILGNGASTQLDPPFIDTFETRVHLSRYHDTLSITLAISSNTYYDPPLFDFMRITPVYKPTATASTKTSEGVYKCDIKHSDVEHGNKYEFDIIMQNGLDLPVPVPVTKLESDINFTQIMKSLLMDVYSVDVCLFLDSENNYPNVGIWAHRVILSKYKKFDELIQSAIKHHDPSIHSVMSDVLSDSSDSTLIASHESKSNNPVVQIKGFSLATVSVLLRYIYTGEIVLSVDLKTHVLSSFKASLVIHDADGTTQETQLGPVATWKLKDTTWEELLEAANYLGVTELQKKSEEAVINALEETSVLNTLFITGAFSSKVREAALAFIVKNMSELIVDDKNPFDAYKSHQDCHDYMFEVIRRCGS